MKVERWQRIEELLDAALECGTAERAALLERSCANDAGLRREIESLLEHQSTSESFIETPAFALAAEMLADDAVDKASGANDALEERWHNQHIGAYKVIREIGRGGMGAVFLAERDDGEFRQQVALKVVRRGFASSELARRFRQERQILASLNHPNIAKLLDGGVSGDGEPYFIMEHVEGSRIDDYCDARRLPINARLRLFLRVCEAVAYAHQHLIVHRDLKPSNILVTEEGTPKLLDFGIAKLLDAEHAGEQTRTDFRAFTPDYAAPEQIAGHQITTASDVFSLGVLLRDLLHGARDAQLTPGGWRGAGSSEKAVAANGNNEQKRAAMSGYKRTVGVELENIVAMARREEPARRYASVVQLAEDIQRYLDNLPVRAQKDSFSYRAEKFVRRNKAPAAAAALVLLSLVAGFAAVLWEANIARGERDRAAHRFADVRQLSNALLTDIAPKMERLEGSTEARQALVNQSLKYLDSLAREAGGDAQLQSELAAAYERVGELQGAPRKPNLSDFTGAIASYEKARAIRRKTLEQKPNDADNQKSLAMNASALSNIRWWTGDLRASLVDSESALETYERLLAAQPHSFDLQMATSEAQIDLANSYYYNDQLARVYPPLEKAIQTLETLDRQNPPNVEILRLLGRAYTLLAMTLSWDGKQTEGEALMAKATSINESLVAKFPHDNVLRQGLWHTYLQSSQLYEEVNDSLSLQILSKAARLADDSVKSDKENAQAQQNAAKTYSSLGVINVRLKKNDEAVFCLEKSLAQLKKLEATEPENFTYKGDIGRDLTYLGLAKYQQRNFFAALASYDKAVKVFEDHARADPVNNFPRRKLASVYTYVGDAYRDLQAQSADAQNRQTLQRAAKENYERALKVFLQLQSQNALAEFDLKHLQEAQSTVQKYERW